jgi:hypothetical protein
MGQKPINHALFADDSLLIGGASNRIARAIDSVLKSYCRATGAVINDSKSEIYSWNISHQELEGITSILGFKGHENWERIQYLGLPIIAGGNKRSVWTSLISKIKNRISAWGGFWLTRSGKATLIKSVLSAIPSIPGRVSLSPQIGK